ncbi:unnamed protein product [Natator depressus]
MIYLAHGGHLKVKKIKSTLARLQATSWWPNVSSNVGQFVNNCLPCAANNADSKVIKGPLRNQRIEAPWAHFEIDYIGPLPRTARVNLYCLVIVDPFTKWNEAITTENNTAQITAQVLIK